jgi:hypothetical protein
MRLDLFDADAKVGIGAKRAGGRPGGAQRIDETIKPTEQQKAAFDALKSASAKAASDLDASCPADMPEKLTDRLDMVAKRLDALADAVDTVKPALTDFYNTLSDEQKARFNVIRPGPRCSCAAKGNKIRRLMTGLARRVNLASLPRCFPRWRPPVPRSQSCCARDRCLLSSYET